MRIDSGWYVDTDPHADLSAGSADVSSDGDVLWAEITLPCDVHRQLVADGRVADPDAADDNDECAWVQQRAWWFRFQLPAVAELADGERLLLVCDRLDTQASLWLDGEPLGRHANAFRPATFALPPGSDNSQLLIRIEPPTPDPDGSYLTARQRLRKPAYGYGWDFAPVRPSIGIGSLRLIRRQASIQHVDVRTLEIGDPARLQVRVEADCPTGVTPKVRLRLIDPDGRDVATGDTTPGTPFTLYVPSPRLWWTHDQGEPTLYRLEVELVVGDHVVDAATRSVGIRTVTLDRSPDPSDPGAEQFRFLLNGRAIAALGANWVPTGTAVAAPAEERVRELVGAARDAGMSMLRVWGGGYYECDAFYDTCNRLGLLVWQDFMFANADYPVDVDFLAKVEQEARHQVRRLSAHPCLALWCGNNEIEVIASLLGWENPRPATEIFDELLPRVVAENSDLGYIASSPCDNNSPRSGDRHNWQVWHGVDVTEQGRQMAAWALGQPALDGDLPETRRFVAAAQPRRYLEDESRFVSEYGLASYPSFSALEHWLAPTSLVRDHPSLLARARPATFGPANKMDLFMAATVGLPEDLSDYVRRSQLLQAEGIKLGTEHYRRCWPGCAGALLWQLGDCWPAISWSLVDHDLRRKTAWWYARRFFSPVLVSLKPVAGGVEVWLTNNGPASHNEPLVVRTTTFDGEPLWQSEVTACGEPGQSHAVAGWSLDEVAAGPANYLSVTGRSPTSYNRHFFTEIVDMRRTPPAVDVMTQPSKTGLAVTVSAETFALAVTVEAGSTVFDDNCFDLHPGTSKTVYADGVPAGTPVEVTAL